MMENTNGGACRGIDIEFRAQGRRKHLRSDYSGIFAGVFKFPAGPTVMAIAG